MAEATRLTRSGRLSEAVALIQTRAHGAGRAGRRTRHTATRIAADIALVATGARCDPAVDPAPLRRAVLSRRPRARLDLDAARPPRPGRGTAPAPADVVPAGGRFIAGSFTNAAGTRAYKLYVPQPPRRPAASAHRHAARLHAIARRFRRRHAHELRRRGARLPRRLSGAAAAANAQKCWNWFKPSDQQRERRRARADRRHHARRSCATTRRSAPRLRRRAFGRRRGGGHHGRDLSRSLCRGRRAFRAWPAARPATCRRPSRP